MRVLHNPAGPLAEPSATITLGLTAENPYTAALSFADGATIVPDLWADWAISRAQKLRTRDRHANRSSGLRSTRQTHDDLPWSNRHTVLIFTGKFDGHFAGGPVDVGDRPSHCGD